MQSINTSFAGLFGRVFPSGNVVHSVEIPELQRDYAQGRQDARTQKVRAAFLDAIGQAVRGKSRLGLDFVYGELTQQGALQPVDGQQRLTTLFLLHWYLAARTGRLPATGEWRRFSYRTRPGARRFCERICDHPADFSGTSPSAWIKDQSWCPPTWREDPTIASMLVVLDDLHEMFRDDDCEAAWSRLVEAPVPAITFDVLPVKELGPADELYIRMNSRGKPLTDLEVFKARFEQLLEAISPEFPVRFATCVDNQWSDVFWPYRGGNDIVDEELLRYLRFTTELCAWREGRQVDHAGDLEAVAAQVFDPNDLSSTTRVTRLFSAIDAWVGVDVPALFKSIFTHNEPLDSDSSAPLRIFPSAAGASVDLFGACCKSFDPKRTERAFGWPEALLFYAVLVDRLQPVSERQLRLRTIRNLVESSSNEMRSELMPVLVTQVERIMSQGLPETVAGFTAHAVSEEQAKLAFITAQPELGNVLRRLEDHQLLRGSLVAFELEASSFKRRARAFEELMINDPSRLYALTAALLVRGNPMLRVSKFHVLGSSRNLGHWRDRLTGASRNAMTATRAALASVLDVIASRGDVPVDVALNEFTTGWTQECLRQRQLDWRWYLASYPVMRSGATGRYASSEGGPGYSLCMLEKSFMHSYYRDPWLQAMRTESGLPAAVEDKWFTGSEWLPRWMPLVRSDIGFQACIEGIRIQVPETRSGDTELEAHLKRLGLSLISDRLWVLEVPRMANEDGMCVDTEDRVQIGARLIRDLVNAGY